MTQPDKLSGGTHVGSVHKYVSDGKCLRCGERADSPECNPKKVELTMPDRLTVKQVEESLIGEPIDNEVLAIELLYTLRENERLRSSLNSAYEQIKKVARSYPRQSMGYDVDEVREALSNKDWEHPMDKVVLDAFFEAAKPSQIGKNPILIYAMPVEKSELLEISMMDGLILSVSTAECVPRIKNNELRLQEGDMKKKQQLEVKWDHLFNPPELDLRAIESRALKKSSRFKKKEKVIAMTTTVMRGEIQRFLYNDEKLEAGLKKILDEGRDDYTEKNILRWLSWKITLWGRGNLYGHKVEKNKDGKFYCTKCGEVNVCSNESCDRGADFEYMGAGPVNLLFIKAEKKPKLKRKK